MTDAELEQMSIEERNAYLAEYEMCYSEWLAEKEYLARHRWTI